MSYNVADVGHAERAWRDWPGFDSLAVIAPEILVPEGYRAVIVAPRADDETLGLGGLLARLIMIGRPILLVAATDRAAATRAPSRWTPQQKASEWMPQPLRALRCPSRTAVRAGRALPGPLKLLQFRDRPVQLAFDRRLVSEDLIHGLLGCGKRSLHHHRLVV